MSAALAKKLENPKEAEGSLVTLNFKVTPAFKKVFKGYAVSQGVTMLDLLKEGFELIKRNRKPQ